jgi:lambda family phage tail tape measure protein
MANNQTITATLQMTDPGATVDKRTRSVERLNAETEKLDRANRRRSVSAAMGENKEYNAGRGIGQGTGAGARDFAKEAKGLGGLVRLYATLAANMFAAEAAFRALSGAMNTENMIAGLDQMGASSGQALGSLSKRFAETTGFAVSLRESVEAVSKASSAGLNQKQILQIAEVAKKASQSLGVNMTDAVSRLTRGIAKMEPELLDELGIYTKLGKATEDYAAKLGKPVSSLTEFERVQAFANAALKEGNKKFGELDIPTNSYDKLLASLTNLSLTMLNLINGPLKYFVDFLATSPMALAGSVAFLGSVIFKKFLPALSEMRAGQMDDANKLKKVAEARAVDATKALDLARDQRKAKVAIIKAELEDEKIARVDAAQKSVEALDKASLTKKALKIVSKTDLSTVTDKQLEYLEKLGKRQGVAGSAYREFAVAVRDAKQANTEYFSALAKEEAKAGKEPSIFTAAGAAQYNAEQARKRSAGKQIIADTGETAAVEGLRAASKKLVSDIKTEKLGLFSGALTFMGGAANIAAAGLSRLASVLSKFMGYIGLALGVWELISSVFGTAGKEMDALKAKSEELTDVIKTATAVSKKYGDELSVSSINAKANAIGNLADTLDTVGPALTAAMEKMGWFTKNIAERLPEWLGGGVIEKLSGQYAEGIMKGIGSAITPEAQKEAQDRLATLLTLDPKKVNKKQLQEALAIAGKVEREGARAIVNDVKQANAELNAPLQKTKAGFESLNKTYLELTNSFINNDIGSKFAVELIGQIANLNDSLADPITRLAQLKDLSKDFSIIKMFPPESQKALIDSAQQIGTITKNIDEAKKQMAEATEKINSATALERGGPLSETFIRIKVEGEGQLAAATRTYEEGTKKLKELDSNLKSAMTVGMSTAVGLLEAPLARAIAQANIASQKAIVSMFPRSEGGVALTAKLELESIQIRKEEITALYNLTKSFDLFRLGEERKSLVQERMANGSASSDLSEKLDKRIKSVDDQINALTAKDYKTAFGKNGENADAQTAAIISRRVGFDSKLAELAGQGKMVEINKARDMVAARYDRIGEQLNNEFASVKASNEQYVKSTEFAKKSDSEKAKEIENIRQVEQQYQNSIAALPGLKDIATIQAGADMAGAGGKGKNASDIATLAKQEIAYSQQKLDALNKQQTSIEAAAQAESNRKIASTDYVEATKSINVELDRQVGIQLQALTQNQSDLDYAKNKLEFEQQFGKYTLDEYARKQLILELDAAEVERVKAKLELQQSFNKSIQDLIATQIAAGNVDSQKSIEERQGLINNNNIALSNLDQQYAGRVRLAQLEKERQDYNGKREQEYAKAFERSMDNMTDSFINFAKTGKFSFKSLANAVIEDIARIEIRMRLMQVAANEGGFLNMAKSFLGFNSSANMTVSPETMATSANAFNISAKGNIFDAGLMQFAKGGMFTNSIVTSPTMFKFAQGAGLMGEAGPEAIMPLKRDSQGNLGVRTNQQQQNVEVVVNNYGSEKATTKETVNNRGERKIEVVIGDAVAGEISRPGSAVQQSLSSNFGNRPAVARR